MFEQVERWDARSIVLTRFFRQLINSSHLEGEQVSTFRRRISGASSLFDQGFFSTLESIAAQYPFRDGLRQ